MELLREKPDGICTDPNATKEQIKTVYEHAELFRRNYGLGTIPDEELKDFDTTKAEKSRAIVWLIDHGYVDESHRPERIAKPVRERAGKIKSAANHDGQDATASSAPAPLKPPKVLKSEAPLSPRDIPDFILLTFEREADTFVVRATGLKQTHTGKPGRPAIGAERTSNHTIPLAALDHDAFAIEAHLRACWPGREGYSAWDENGRPARNQVWYRLVSRVKLVALNILPEGELE